MADDKRNNSSFGAGFMADMLKDLQKQYEIDKKPKGKGKRGRHPKSLRSQRESLKGSPQCPATKPQYPATKPQCPASI